MPGIGHVDVDGEEDAVALVHGDGEGLGEALVEAARDYLGHLVGPHALLGHPLQDVRRRPVAAQPDLQEAIPACRAGLDEPAHGLAVPDERAELDVAGVGMRVEVQHGDPAPAARACHPGDVGPGDGVVAAEDERHGTGLRHALHDHFEIRARSRGVAAVHLYVAAVHDAQVLESVGAQREGGTRAIMSEIARHAQGLRAEARAAAVRRAAVEGCPDDDHIGVGVGGRVLEVAGGHAEEGEVRAVLAAVARHPHTLGLRSRARLSCRSRGRGGRGCAARGCVGPRCDRPCRWSGG